MPNYNKILLIGNLTNDPYSSQKSDKSITHFSIAVDEQWVDAGGDRQKETLFIDVTAFNRPAELIMEQFCKGDPILVEGKLKMRRGFTSSKTFQHEVVLNRFEVIRSGDRGF
mgnify:CR=1 FL=1